MGTSITLEVGGLELAWSKNSMGLDHGMLFQEPDRRRTRSDQINYEYFEQTGEDPGSREMAFVRSLRQVLPRLELLGFTLGYVEADYARAVKELGSETPENDGEPDSSGDGLLSFAEYLNLIKTHSIGTLDATFISGIDADSDRKVRGQFSGGALEARIPYGFAAGTNAYSERSYFAGLIGILHPYSVLRALAECVPNLEEPVVWQYGPLVDSGWAQVNEFVPNARRTDRFLVATEGSSDAHILSHAFLLLRPEIVDFFQFIDVSDRHPFPGTGNLLRFAEGLAKIDVHNQAVFVFDNDAEGCDAFAKLKLLNLPMNMKALVLPDQESFRNFPAKGPNGIACADINGRAAAIECYLDLALGGYPPALVVWTNYRREQNLYHGSLEHKESYTKAFLKETVPSVQSGTYNFAGIRAVLDSIIGQCTSMASESRKAAIDPVGTTVRSFKS